MNERRSVKGCCPLDCQDTCAWVAEVEDGRVTSVRGVEGHPVTPGALGASRQTGGICSVSATAVAKEGLPYGFDPEEMVESHLILLWGINLLSTCHHNWHFVQEARRLHGARIVCIDPIRTRTARQCD